MIKLENVSKIYNNNNKSTIALNNVSLKLEGNGIVMISGPSGSGKTTLVKVIAGLLLIDDGNLIFNDKDISYYSDRQLEDYFFNNCYFVKQENNLISNYTVKDNLIIACEDENKTFEVDYYLNKFGMDDLKNCKVKDLSLGEMQRIAIIRGLIKKKDILILDEPIASLDKENAKIVLEMLDKVKEEHLIIIVTHDTETVLPYANRVIKMDSGTIVSDKVIKSLYKKNINSQKEKPKNKIYKPFKYGLKNTFSYPLRLLLKVLIINLIIFAMAIGKTVLIPDFSEKKYDVKLITLYKPDKWFLTKTDLDYVAKLPINNIDYNYGDTFYERINLGQGEKLFLIKPYNEHKVIKGNPITNSNEVLVPIQYSNRIGDKVRLEIGKIENQLFTIVGVTEDQDTLYISKEIYNKDYITVKNIQDYYKQLIFKTEENESYGSISEIYYSNENYNNLYLSKKYIADLNIDDSIIGKIVDVELMHFENGIPVSKIIKANVALTNNDFKLNVSLELGKESLKDFEEFSNPREIRFCTKKLKDVEKVLSSLDDYVAIYNYEKIKYSKNYFFNSLKLSIINYIIWIILIILVSFLFIILDKNEKKIYDVYRYLGYSKKFLIIMKLSCLFFIYIIALGLNFIIYLVLNNSSISFFIDVNNFLIPIIPTLICIAMGLIYETNNQFQKLLGEE